MNFPSRSTTTLDLQGDKICYLIVISVCSAKHTEIPSDKGLRNKFPFAANFTLDFQGDIAISLFNYAMDVLSKRKAPMTTRKIKLP